MRPKRPPPKRPVRRLRPPTPPLPVTILGVTYHPKPKDWERFTPENRQVKLH